MAIAISGPILGTYDPNITDGSGGFNLFKQIENRYDPAVNASGNRPFTFIAEGQSVGNEAVTLALLAPINLTALGVVFPASSLRNIRCRTWSRRATVANAGYTEKWYTVIGGATPSIAPDATLAAIVAAANNPAAAVRIPNNNSAAAPEYGEGIVIMDAVATTNVIVGVQNIVGLTNVAATATLMRWRLEVWVDTLVALPVAA
jgi:hypothetical protein